MKTRPYILLVDDREENLVALEGLLKHHDAALLRAHSGVEALELLLVHDIALALLDVHMPEMDGFALAELMRGAERTREIPIIFVTAALHDPVRVFKGYESGAVDFLLKPLDPGILSSKVSVFLQLHRQKQELAGALAASQQAVLARDQVVSMVSHDLRNPLNNIAMQLTLLRRMADAGTLDEANLEAGLGRIGRGVSKMEKIISELTDVARLQAGEQILLEHAEVDLVKLSAQLADEYQRTSKKHTLEVRCSAPAIVGLWDHTRIERVLDNLLSNAVKYSPNGGTILIDIGAEQDDSQQWVRVRIRDEGVGIPASDLRHVFQWFSRAQNVAEAFRGTGIGLAGAHHIVQHHGGVIEVESEEGKGSTFTVRLPLRPPGREPSLEER